MSLAFDRPPRLSGEDYLAWEQAQERRYELVDGQPRMMAGGTRRHHRIAENVSFALRTRLQRPCFALREQKVVTPQGNYRYPDVTVDCGANQRPEDLAAVEPRLIFEVESPSNTEIDMAERLDDYKTIPALRQIVLIAQNRPQARIYTREGETWRGVTLEGLGQSLELTSVGCVLPFAEIYEEIAFEAPPAV